MIEWHTLDGKPSRIIAHRGSSGHRPEHTLDGYTLAIAQGADVIEPDLVFSRDGIAYARHDIGLRRSTDIAARPEFAARAREMDGTLDWWVGDFLAEELDDLRAIQPYPGRDRGFDGRYALPRFSQILELATAAGERRGRALPVYPEIKDPDYFHTLGLDPVEIVARELERHGLLGADSSVWIQCFDHAELRRAHARCGNPCFALFETLPTDAEQRAALLENLASWARGIAPGKYLLWDNAGNDSGLTAQAHALGLQVHTWTFREDASPAPYTSNRAELQAAFALGIDAMFCDFPDAGVAARDAFESAGGA